jgi:hypothetical protein
MQTPNIIPGQWQMPQRTSQPGSSQMCLGLEKPQPHTDIASRLPGAVANSSPIGKA